MFPGVHRSGRHVSIMKIVRSHWVEQNLSLVNPGFSAELQVYKFETLR